MNMCYTVRSEDTAEMQAPTIRIHACKRQESVQDRQTDRQTKGVGLGNGGRSATRHLLEELAVASQPAKEREGRDPEVGA